MQHDLLSWSPRVSVARQSDRPSIEDRFRAFHAANPHVFEEMLRLARVQLNAGARRVSAKRIWEEMRANLARTSGAAFKLDNSLCSRFADACIEAEPRLALVMERRHRKAR